MPALLVKENQRIYIRSLRSIPLVVIVIHLLTSPQHPITDGRWWWGLLISFLLTVTFWLGNVLIVLNVQNRFPKASDNSKKLLLQIPLQIVYVLIAGTSMVYVINLIPAVRGDVPLENCLMSGLGVSAIITVLSEAVFYLNNWKQKELLVEQLSKESVEARFDVLRSQVNPHFLFNSLNSLAQLIEEDRIQALDFVHHLSKHYRYVLEDRSTVFSPVEEEMDMVRNYVELLKIRFQQALNIHIDQLDRYNNHFILPQSVQLAVENAVKHNVCTSAKPLLIEIYYFDGAIVIRNSLQTKSFSANESTGFGLENIRIRYEMMGVAGFSAGTQNDAWVVRLPFIPSEKRNEHRSPHHSSEQKEIN
jgi:hypothetical protein